MAANDQYDLLLNGKGYMLVRSKSMAARAWKRSGVNVSPAGQSPDEGRFNAGPAEIRFADTWDDFSGGFGYAYRTSPSNGIHWSENMDTRFAGQAVHCQAMLHASLWDEIDNVVPGGFQWLIDLALTGPVPPVGFGAVYAYGRRQNLVGNRDSWTAFPTPRQFPATLDATAASVSSRNGLEGPPAIFGSYLYVGGGSGNFYEVGFDGRARSTGAINIQGFVNAGNRLWGKIQSRGGTRPIANAVASVAAGADPKTAGNWSATIPVGNGSQPIQDMESLGGQVFLGLPDGIYAGDQTGTFVNVTGPIAGNGNPDNFRDLCVHSGQVIGQHLGGIVAYDPTNTTGVRVREIGPAPHTNRSPVQGFDTAVESFGGWLYAAKWTGSQSWLMAGRDTGAGWRWNLLNRMPVSGRVSRLHFDGITAASGVPQTGLPVRLWAAMDGSYGAMTEGVSGATAPLYFQPIPPLNRNPLAPAPFFSANYNGSARMVGGRSDRGAPGVLKVYEYAEVWADAFLSGSRYADVYYQIDDGPRTLLGRVQTSPVSRLYFTQSNPTFYRGRSIEWDMESFDTTPGTCQVYRAVEIYGKMRPKVAAVYDAVIHVGDNVPDRRGTPLRPGRVMIDELRSYEDPDQLGGQALTLIDLAGATQQVVLVPPITESEYYQDGRNDPEVAATVRLAVLTYSGS